MKRSSILLALAAVMLALPGAALASHPPVFDQYGSPCSPSANSLSSAQMRHLLQTRGCAWRPGFHEEQAPAGNPNDDGSSFVALPDWLDPSAGGQGGSGAGDGGATLNAAGAGGGGTVLAAQANMSFVGGALPLTGLDVLLLAIAASFLLGSGVALRRATR